MCSCTAPVSPVVVVTISIAWCVSLARTRCFTVVVIRIPVTHIPCQSVGIVIYPTLCVQITCCGCTCSGSIITCRSGERSRCRTVTAGCPSACRTSIAIVCQQRCTACKCTSCARSARIRVVACFHGSYGMCGLCATPSVVVIYTIIRTCFSSKITCRSGAALCSIIPAQVPAVIERAVRRAVVTACHPA